MNRTTAFLGLAGALALLALAAGLPRSALGVPRPTGLIAPPSAEGSLRLSARLSHPYVGEGTSDVFATLQVEAVPTPGEARSPVNLAVVIDRSGSMAGQKLQQAKAAARRLVELMRDDDRIALIHFGSDVKTIASSVGQPLSKQQVLSAIDAIADEGGTNISAGLNAAYRQVSEFAHEYKVNRIILLSDGEPTEGLTSANDLQNEARGLKRRGVTLSAMGLGTDFNEDLMQSMAELGGGAYAYLNDPAQLATIFQRDLLAASTTVARNVTLCVELPDGVRLTEVLGYSSQVAGRTVTIPMPDFASGQVERVVVRLAVDAPARGETMDVSRVRLAYADLLDRRSASSSARLSAVVTDRAEEIAAHQDKEVAVVAARAQSAENTAQAAESLSKGDRAQAQRYLIANEALLNAAATVAGPAAVQQDLDDQRAVEQQFQSAASQDEVRHSVKAAKRKARLDVGKIGSTY